MKIQPETPSAPESCSAQGSQSGTAGLERSSSSFRANAPARLKRYINSRRREARRNSSECALIGNTFFQHYWSGYAAALGELAYWIKQPKRKRALARNNDSATAVR